MGAHKSILKISHGRWGKTTPNSWLSIAQGTARGALPRNLDLLLFSSLFRFFFGKAGFEDPASTKPALIRGAKSMVMEFHGNVRGEVRVNFLALFASKPHIPSNCPELFARTFA